MKALKKLFALLLALAMVFCLFACDSSGDDDDKDGKGSSSKKRDGIKGEWSCKLDFADTMNENMPEGVSVKGHLYVNLNLEFKESEFTLSMSPDEDSLDDFSENYVDTMVDYMKDQAEQRGMSVSDMEDQLGKSVEEYCEENVAKTLDQLKTSMTNERSGYYKLDDGKILMADEEEDLEDTETYMEYELDGSELKVSNMISNGEEAPEVLAKTFPWVFE